MEPYSLNPAMIENHLRNQELKFRSDQDGRFQVPFDGVTFVIAVEGEHILVIQSIFTTDDALTAEGLISFANQWNTARRWPRLFVEDSTLRGDVHQFVLGPVTQAAVDHIIAFAFGGSFLVECDRDAFSTLATVDIDDLVDQLLTD